MSVPLRCLVIDPESSGLDLVAALRERGADVRTYEQRRPFVLTGASDESRPEDALIRFGERCRPDHVLAGSESSVSAAEWLADHLDVPGSPLRSAFPRRNKDAMMQRVRRVGLAHVSSLAVASLDELRQRRAEVAFPAFVKPAASAGSDRCRAVEHWGELEQAVQAVLTSEPIMGIGNETAVVQDFIDGPQFFVNAVTVAGRHLVTDVFGYRLRVVDGAPQLFAGRSDAVDAPEVRATVEYVLRCLDALEVREGASHTEVRVGRSGPVLIELNARLMGPMQPAAVFLAAQGYSQATVWAVALTAGPEEAHRLLRGGDVTCCIGWYLLTAPRSGLLRSIDRALLGSVPCFAGAYGLPSVGTRIITDNRVTTADLGIVYLTHPNARAVEAGLEVLARHEAAGVIVDIDPCAPGADGHILQGC